MRECPVCKKPSLRYSDFCLNHADAGEAERNKPTIEQEVMLSHIEDAKDLEAIKDILRDIVLKVFPWDALR